VTFPAAFLEEVSAVVRCLETESIPYAVGGAICLGYHTEPRGTTDIDVDVFLAPSDARRVIDALTRAGLAVVPDRDDAGIDRDGQARLLLDDTYIDLFFAFHAFHESCAARALRVQFEGAPMNILSAEDIVVFKVLFNRSHDWIDIQKVLVSCRDTFDIAYVTGWLRDMLGSDDSRVARLDGLFATARAAQD
jgi:hypothetical protein